MTDREWRTVNRWKLFSVLGILVLEFQCFAQISMFFHQTSRDLGACATAWGRSRLRPREWQGETHGWSFLVKVLWPHEPKTLGKTMGKTLKSSTVPGPGKIGGDPHGWPQSSLNCLAGWALSSSNPKDPKAGAPGHPNVGWWISWSMPIAKMEDDGGPLMTWGNLQMGKLGMESMYKSLVIWWPLFWEKKNVMFWPQHTWCKSMQIYDELWSTCPLAT